MEVRIKWGASDQFTLTLMILMIFERPALAARLGRMTAGWGSGSDNAVVRQIYALAISLDLEAPLTMRQIIAIMNSTK